jgi:hypothetical protein
MRAITPHTAAHQELNGSMTDEYFWIIFVFVHEALPLFKANVTDLTICLQ